MGDSNTISEGIYIGNINVSGKTAGEAKQDVEAYIEELKGQTVTFQVMDGNQVEAAVGDLGLKWANQDAVQDAIALGKKGNIIQRYKALQDLRHENKVFELAYDFDKEAIRKILAEQCMEYNTEAKDAVLTRTNGVFSVTPGQSGYVIDEEASVDQIYEYLMNEWDFQDVSVEVVAKVQEPRGTEEELLQVKDVLGTFTTSYSTSGSSRSANVSNGCNLIAGATLYPGDEFSTYEAVSPFSVDNGYFMAGSYMNGQVVDSLGGGICQVSTTLYNAVLLSELEVTERHNHSMIVTYVDPSADAAIAESAGKDFKFINNTEHPIYIDGYCGNSNGVRTFADCISLANSGSVGSCFYHPYEYVASDHVTAIKRDGLDKYAYLFVAALFKRLGKKYSFNREISDKRLRREVLILPIDESQAPAWEAMSNYVKEKERAALYEYLSFLETNG